MCDGEGGEMREGGRGKGNFKKRGEGGGCGRSI